MIAYTGSRVLEDNTIVFVGTGLPIIASIHAQLTYAPGLGIIFEAGPLTPILEMGCRCLSAIPGHAARLASSKGFQRYSS